MREVALERKNNRASQEVKYMCPRGSGTRD